MRRPSPRALSLALVPLAIGLAPSAARANEADTYGLGSRATAMGGAVAADAADFSGNYYNPAALAGARGPSLSVGYVHVWNRLQTNGQDNGVADVRGIVAGLALPGKIAGIPFAFGVGLYMPDSGLSQVVALEQTTPRWPLYGESSSIVFIAANLAVRPLPWLEIGGGVAFLAATKGSFQITGMLDIMSLYQSQLRHEVDADLSAVRYPQVGARFKVPGFGYLAAVYRGQTQLNLQLTAHLQGTVSDIGLQIPLTYDLTTQTSDAFLPQQVVVGASFQRIPRLSANLDFVFVNWAAYQSPTAVTTANLQVDLPAGLGSLISLPPNPKPVTLIPPGFQNRLVPHIGVEYVIPVAGGLRHLDGDPTNYIDTDRHTVSLGTGLTLNAPGSVLKGSITLDVHGAFSILPDRTTLKQNPADFVGDYTAGGTMINVGSTLTAVF
jgi:long-subunit fatty acid transport protein